MTLRDKSRWRDVFHFVSGMVSLVKDVATIVVILLNFI